MKVKINNYIVNTIFCECYASYDGNASQITTNYSVVQNLNTVVANEQQVIDELEGRISFLLATRCAWEWDSHGITMGMGTQFVFDGNGNRGGNTDDGNGNICFLHSQHFEFL